jgi:uncharacterized protein YdeI (YjbR/CyaY-like superfamily)
MKSRWSKLNVTRMVKMIKKGRAIPQAIDIFKNAEKNGLFQNESIEKDNINIPYILIDTLRKDKTAEEFYSKLNTREKEAYSHFISDAKKEETRQKRLKEMVVKLKDGWRMPYFKPLKNRGK